MIILIEIFHYFNKGNDDASTNYILATFIEIKVFSVQYGGVKEVDDAIWPVKFYGL
jgi:hypothetical protein